MLNTPGFVAKQMGAKCPDAFLLKTPSLVLNKMAGKSAIPP